MCIISSRQQIPGALTIDAFLVGNISLCSDADWKRRGLYIGSQARLSFDTLDVTVQEEFDRFLQERGITDSLATFIPDYAEFKEQKVRPLLFFFAGFGN
ncbi:hypothetical protein BXZ70DRAFT_899731 [Cristinia sonorae]|uniref:Uncharacterized protein n=1 Tax=Cristinia sonorae TaxID=1940300 RepID=A0A8K0UGU5_9AGAR|nr:hypothetical protein BXZ70DRAFT_899731 [Cristinia sonorae]